FERRTRTLAAGLGRLGPVADVDLVERDPVVRHLGVFLDDLLQERGETSAEAEIERHQQALASRDTTVERERDRIDRCLGERLQDLRVDGLVDELMAPTVRRVERAVVEELLQPRAL